MKTGYCPAASTLRPAMISYGLGKWNKDPLRGMPSLVFQPEPRRALSGFPVTKNLLMASPDNVQSKAFIYRYDQGTWRATPIPLPTNENVSLSAASEETDVVLFTVSGLENRLEGEAIGEQAGCAFHWKYARDTPQAGGKSFKLNFDDWFYAIDERVCIVRGSTGRAGIPFATAHVTYRKL